MGSDTKMGPSPPFPADGSDQAAQTEALRAGQGPTWPHEPWKFNFSTWACAHGLSHTLSELPKAHRRHFGDALPRLVGFETSRSLQAGGRPGPQQRGEPRWQSLQSQPQTILLDEPKKKLLKAELSSQQQSQTVNSEREIQAGSPP